MTAIAIILWILAIVLAMPSFFPALNKRPKSLPPSSSFPTGMAEKGNQRLGDLTEVALSLLPEEFVVFDLETTGLSPDSSEIIEIGALKVSPATGEFQTFQTLVVPDGRIPPHITKLTGIDPAMIRECGIPLEQALLEFRAFVRGRPTVAYNARFDDAFIREACWKVGISPFISKSDCALRLAKLAWPERNSHRLADLARE